VSEVHYEIATAQSLGRRDCQEDALVAHFPQGGDFGFAVLADGMGGHAAGDIASKIVVTEVFSELLFQTGELLSSPGKMAGILREAAHSADACLAAYVASNPDTKGMGATLVAPAILGQSLWWVSIGDSPLFLFRNGILSQLNEDHSLAPQIDFMAATGLLDPASARDHPDRNVLTSVLFGQSVAKVDCIDTPVALQIGDMVVVASDGLQFLDNDQISAVLTSHSDLPCDEIAHSLLASIARQDHPDQDNVSFCIIRVRSKDLQSESVRPTERRHFTLAGATDRAEG
jgi:PPM family protein phosphatase